MRFSIPQLGVRWKRMVTYRDGLRWGIEAQTDRSFGVIRPGGVELKPAVGEAMGFKCFAGGREDQWVLALNAVKV